MDATLGEAGTPPVLALEDFPGSTFFACDQDGEAVERFRTQLDQEHSVCQRCARRFCPAHSRGFGYREAVRGKSVSPVSAVFADLGLSSDQLGDAARGFSFLREGAARYAI